MATSLERQVARYLATWDKYEWQHNPSPRQTRKQDEYDRRARELIRYIKMNLPSGRTT